jgi:hypothetical protein
MAESAQKRGGHEVFHKGLTVLKCYCMRNTLPVSISDNPVLILGIILTLVEIQIGHSQYDCYA